MITMLCTDIFFPLAKNGKGNQVKRELLDSKEKWVIATLKKHHKPKNEKNRPYCLCMPTHPKMQIYSHPNGNLYVKRLADTGMQHHTDCPSYGETVSSKKIDYQDAISIKDGIMNISAASSLTLHTKARAPKGEEGGSQRTGTARHRLSLKDSFHFIWNEAGLGTQKENEKVHYNFIKDKLNAIASNISYSGTLLENILIIPDALQPNSQKALIQEKAKSNTPEKKLILIGMLNKLKHIEARKDDKNGFSKYYLFLYNGPNCKPPETIPYYLDSDLFKKCQHSLNFSGKEWEYVNTKSGKVWVIAIIENKQNAAGVTYGKVSEIAFIPVTNEHVPC